MVYIVMAYVFMAYRVLATQGGLKRAKKRDWYIAGTKQRLGPMVRKMCITPEQLYFNLTKYQDHYPPDIEQCVFFFVGTRTLQTVAHRVGSIETTESLYHRQS